MTMTDPIADMLTRVRNALHVRHKEVKVPLSGLKCEIARILKEEGYITDFTIAGEPPLRFINIKLKYGDDNEKVITAIKRVSKPGLRVYVSKEEVPKVLNGLGIAILSTSQGVITDKSARELGIGGELLCSVY